MRVRPARPLAPGHTLVVPTAHHTDVLDTPTGALSGTSASPPGRPGGHGTGFTGDPAVRLADALTDVRHHRR
ncbi:hypothetical protein [Streptomyces sp. MUSC 14]|uniref:hypothetical protein n=1 Tax=Streptomyces sp. MUSC 14 TaxID=1354889 RepID=UPI001160CA40|nr:hypothetical protein [Streptomyces sp. MUSC 14]